jgi:hypothetical protein
MDCAEDVFMDRPQQEDEPSDYEKLCASGDALVYAAISGLAKTDEAGERI